MTCSTSALSPAKLAAAIEKHEYVDRASLPGRTNHLPGAVLVPVILDEAINCIVTIRPQHLRLHGGEVVFPGGGPEPKDKNLQATALREAHEELGLENIEVVGRLSSLPLYTSDYRLHPFVGVVPKNFRLTPNPNEVESVHYLSILEHFNLTQLHAIPFQLPGENIHLSPVFEVADRLMFGGTSYAFFEVMSIIAGILGKEMPPLRPGRYDWHDIMPASLPKPF